jgi:hypothetical protein
MIMKNRMTRSVGLFTSINSLACMCHYELQLIILSNTEKKIYWSWENYCLRNRTLGLQNVQFVRTKGTDFKGVKVKCFLYRPWSPLGLREVESPTFLGIRLIDGGKVVSPTCRPLFTLRKIPDTHFC